MSCSDCFYCEPRSEYFFCSYHSLEVFNPTNAGCSNNSVRNVKCFKKLFKVSDTDALSEWFEHPPASGIICSVS